MVNVSGRAINVRPLFLCFVISLRPSLLFLLSKATGAKRVKWVSTIKITHNAHYDALCVFFFAKVKRPKNIKHYFG